MEHATLKRKILKISENYLQTNGETFSDEQLDTIIAEIFFRYEKQNEKNESLTMIAHDVVYDFLQQ